METLKELKEEQKQIDEEAGSSMQNSATRRRLTAYSKRFETIKKL